MAEATCATAGCRACEWFVVEPSQSEVDRHGKDTGHVTFTRLHLRRLCKEVGCPREDA